MKTSKKYNITSENFNGLTYLQRADLFCPSIRRIMSLKLLSIGGNYLIGMIVFLLIMKFI